MLYESSPIELARLSEKLAGAAGSQQALASSLTSVVLRAGTFTDLDALDALEFRAFTHDRIARRSLARFLSSPKAQLIVADYDGVCTAMC